MKNYLIVLLVFIAKMSFSQGANRFYQTSNKEYAFTFEDGVCKLYGLSPYDNLVYREWELGQVYKEQSQSDSLGILFSNGQYAISYDYKYFRVCKLKNGKVKDRHTFVAKRLENPSRIYEAINHAYWDSLYWKTIERIASSYPLFREYRYRLYQPGDQFIWESMTFKQEAPETFEILATERNKLLIDSLTDTNNQLVSLNDSVEKNIHTLTVDELKLNLMSRPIHVNAYDEYQERMLESVAKNRPDLFFDLAEILPEEKKYLFDQIYFPDAVKSLKRFDTDAPIKKEFVRYHRRERLKMVLITTGAGLLEAGVIGGAITGIVYWIRK